MVDSTTYSCRYRSTNELLIIQAGTKPEWLIRVSNVCFSGVRHLFLSYHLSRKYSSGYFRVTFQLLHLHKSRTKQTANAKPLASVHVGLAHHIKLGAEAAAEHNQSAPSPLSSGLYILLIPPVQQQPRARALAEDQGAQRKSVCG